eukprot:8913890-Lingulodinium_polyedra.AAC.1
MKSAPLSPADRGSGASAVAPPSGAVRPGERFTEAPPMRSRGRFVGRHARPGPAERAHAFAPRLARM